MPSISARVPEDDEAAIEAVADLLEAEKVPSSGRPSGRGWRTSGSGSPSSATSPARSP